MWGEKARFLNVDAIVAAMEQDCVKRRMTMPKRSDSEKAIIFLADRLVGPYALSKSLIKCVQPAHYDVEFDAIHEDDLNDEGEGGVFSSLANPLVRYYVELGAATGFLEEPTIEAADRALERARGEAAAIFNARRQAAK
jgi:hypothetical protein